MFTFLWNAFVVSSSLIGETDAAKITLGRQEKSRKLKRGNSLAFPVQTVYEPVTAQGGSLGLFVTEKVCIGMHGLQNILPTLLD
jgi:hypothetical protein